MTTHLTSFAQKFGTASYTMRPQDINTTHHISLDASNSVVDIGITSSNIINNIIGWYPFVGNTLNSLALNLLSVGKYPITWISGPTAGDGYINMDPAISSYGIISGLWTLLSGNNTTCVSLWFKRVSTTSPRSAFGTPFDTNNTSSATAYGCEFAGNTATFYLWRGGSIRTYTLSSTYIDGNWHQMVVNFTGPVNLCDLYIDNILQTSFTGSINLMPSGTGDLWIGEYHTMGNNQFSGALSMFVILNRSLTVTEIGNNYRTQKNIKGF